MRKWLLILTTCLAFGMTTGCAEEMMYVDPPQAVASGPVEFCDDWGCRMVDAPYYYVDGEVVYWDAHFGVWIGPRGYWGGRGWHTGIYPGYHTWYHAGHYRYLHGNPGGWRAGTGWHGGYRGHGHR